MQLNRSSYRAISTEILNNACVPNCNCIMNQDEVEECINKNKTRDILLKRYRRKMNLMKTYKMEIYARVLEVENAKKQK